MNKKALTMGAVMSLAFFNAPAFGAGGRDTINIVGSSTVFPLSTVVAETFGRSGKFKTPKVESTGTGGGFKLFCEGVGVRRPDIVNASRRMKKTEFMACRKAGVNEITEVKIGYDGIVLASAKKAPPLELTSREMFLALAKQVPDPGCAKCDTLVENPYKTWKQINPNLPDNVIEVLGPPPTSGTRDAFAELAMEGACRTFPTIATWEKKDEARFKSVCQTMREDGAYIEAGENDNLIVQKLLSNPRALGIFGYSFLEQNADKLNAAKVDGVEANYDNISNGKYPISRPLFFYVKKAHVGVIPGMAEYIAEFTSSRASGPEGYLIDKGLIPLTESERNKAAEEARKLKNFLP